MSDGYPPPARTDVRALPEVAAIADDVHRSGLPRLLCRDGQELALLAPRGTKRAERSAEDIAAFYASAGGWADEDTDALLAWIYERRGTSKAPVSL